MELVTLFTIVGVLAFSAGGYLFGVRRGVEARDVLREQLRSWNGPASDPLAIAQLDNIKEEFARLSKAVTERDQAERVPNSALLDSILERERLGARLAQLTPEHGLSQLMDAIAEEGHFQAVVIADDGGLPLAANQSCDNSEVLAGVSSLIFILTDRIPRHGMVQPQSLKLHGHEGVTTLYRLFTVGKRRFVLIIVTDDAYLDPALFDSTVSKLKRLLKP